MEPLLKGLPEYQVYPGFITGADLYCHCVKCLGWDKTEKWHLLAALLCWVPNASLVRIQQCSPSLMWTWSVTMDGWQTESCWDILTNYSCWLATGSSSKQCCSVGHFKNTPSFLWSFWTAVLAWQQTNSLCYYLHQSRPISSVAGL